jgi:hypothetical protein
VAQPSAYCVAHLTPPLDGAYVSVAFEQTDGCLPGSIRRLLPRAVLHGKFQYESAGKRYQTNILHSLHSETLHLSKRSQTLECRTSIVNSRSYCALSAYSAHTFCSLFLICSYFLFLSRLSSPSQGNFHVQTVIPSAALAAIPNHSTGGQLPFLRRHG